jgi:hypothetical protein
MLYRVRPSRFLQLQRSRSFLEMNTLGGKNAAESFDLSRLDFAIYLRYGAGTGLVFGVLCNSVKR